MRLGDLIDEGATVDTLTHQLGLVNATPAVHAGLDAQEIIMQYLNDYRQLGPMYTTLEERTLRASLDRI